MDVKQAVITAKIYFNDVFKDESLSHVGLEEVVFDEESKDWKITLGFYRDWNMPSKLADAFTPNPLVDKGRSYKVICINDVDGKVKQLTIRTLPNIEY